MDGPVAAGSRTVQCRADDNGVLMQATSVMANQLPATALSMAVRLIVSTAAVTPVTGRSARAFLRAFSRSSGLMRPSRSRAAPGRCRARCSEAGVAKAVRLRTLTLRRQVAACGRVFHHRLRAAAAVSPRSGLVPGAEAPRPTRAREPCFLTEAPTTTTRAPKHDPRERPGMQRFPLEGSHYRLCVRLVLQGPDRSV